MLMEMNEILEKLPKHLMSLVVDQPYDEYTSRDHAVWRYVMRQNLDYLAKVAHPAYLDGLRKTGISSERIPRLEEMNRILRELGWAAVTVDGFIPPSAFMAFQAYNVLVIAADIRPIDQIGYTPAPDIIHEAAGHAPIIADPEYAAFLKRFGEIGSKAFLSPEDTRLYEAIRHLSIVKADPFSSEEATAAAEKHLRDCSASMGEPSELARIRSLHWWTVEYGLVGSSEDPRIYGAGLLSSIAESAECLKPSVRKIPLTVGAADFSFDITEPQPQLFVTPDFQHLSRILEEFADTMALRRGGLYGMKQAVKSGDTATAVYSSGLQVSGRFTEIIEWNGEPAYVKTQGGTSLCFEGKELEGHSIEYHSHGFGSPVGRIRSHSVALEDFSEEELGQIGLNEGERAHLEFESGVHVNGVVDRLTLRNGRLILVSFRDCTVSYQGGLLFQPEWGTFDMAVGRSIISACAGPADPEAFGLSYPAPAEKTHKITYSEEQKVLFGIYAELRRIREENCSFALLPGLWEKLKTGFPGEWLCALEMYELFRKKKIDDSLSTDILRHLMSLKEANPGLAGLISDGLKLAVA
jgi:phenylalanine-4-hydroxylase